MQEIQETGFQSLQTSPGGGNGNPLQYSCLKVPWTEEPGRLQFMGLHRVRQHLVIKKTTTDSLETFLFIASPNHPTLLFSTDLLLLLLLNCSFHTWLVDSGEVYFSRPWLHHGVHTKYAPCSISSLWCLIPLTSVFNGKQKIKCTC